MQVRLAFLCGTTGWGGLEMNHIRNALWLSQKGYQVKVYCVENSPIHKAVVENKLQFEIIPKHKNHYDFTKAVSLRKKIKKDQITHLFIRATFDMSIAASVKFLSWNNLKVCFLMEMQMTNKKKQFFRTIRYKFIDYWICPLNYLKNQVENNTNFPSSKIHVIQSGIDFKQFNLNITQEEARVKLNLPQNKVIFGLIGRFDKYKGHFLLLEALQLTKHNNFDVIFMGSPTANVKSDYYERVLDEIEHQNLQNRVHVISYQAETSTFYSAIDWTLMTSEAETFGMVTIESFAHGKPVLGSNQAGTFELIQENKNGILFESMNALDLAQKIDFIVEQKNKFNPKEIQEFAKQFDSNLFVSKLEHLLHLKG
ncbi:MAG: glycosyltransferase family 4 protein [Flavobacteriia bacterium]